MEEKHLLPSASQEGFGVTAPWVFSQYIISKSASNLLPDIYLDLENGIFSGWTEDWVYGYLPGDAFVSTHKNTTLYPVLGLLNETATYTLKYVVEFEGQSIDPHENLGHYVKN